jgi:Trk K+ transport system NAD-binding subunit
MEKMIEGHAVVWGYGRAGRAVADALSSLEIPFLVVEGRQAPSDPTRGAAAVNRDPTCEEILMKSGIRRAEVLISTVDSDEQNAFICRTARRLNPSIRIVARARVPESIPEIRRAGADEVVCLEVEGGRSLARAALEGNEH